ncbi:MAG: nitroreductase [Caldilineaceae bacterium]
MNLNELIRTRRTVGGFSDQPVDPDLITELLETAIYAPNHKMTQPWRFIFLRGELRHQYATLRGEMGAEKGKNSEKEYQKFINVPLFLFVVMKNSDHDHTRLEDYAATSALIQNLLLLTWERGIGSAWKTYPDDRRLNKLIDLADDESVVGVIHLGYATGENKTPMRQSAKAKVSTLS